MRVTLLDWDTHCCKRSQPNLATVAVLVSVPLCAGKETNYESAKARLLEAQVAAEEAKAAAQTADNYTQSKQSLYNEALSARNAAKAAYDVAQQELRLVEQAAQNASALLVRIAGTALWAGEKLDRRQLLAADASRKVRTCR